VIKSKNKPSRVNEEGLKTGWQLLIHRNPQVLEASILSLTLWILCIGVSPTHQFLREMHFTVTLISH